MIGALRLADVRKHLRRGVSKCGEFAARTTRRHVLVLSVFTAGEFLTSCSVGPDYKRPALDVPPTYRGVPSQVPTNSLSELPWWEIFKDEKLKELIGTALTNNYDVRIALTHVEQTQAVLAQNRALFFPQIGYQGTVAREKNSVAGNLTFTGGNTIDVFGVGANASWELDLWGRIRRLNESARAQLLASKETQRDVMLSIISQVAQGYFRLLALDAQLQIAQRSTNSFAESLRIFSQRLEQGVVSKLETSAAQAALASAAATVPELERQIFLQENLINLLLGRNPGPLPRNSTLLQQDLLTSVPAGMPSDLLQRRPDIRETEEMVRAANAQVGVAMANFFPRLSLTALFGQVSPDLIAFTSGGANAWNLAANLAGPIFQGGRLVGQYHQAQAARNEAALRYQATVLNALNEVANALISVKRLSEERVEQARAVQAYQVAVQVSMERYIAGRASYYEVLQEQQLLFPAENTLVQVELNQFVAFVQLYQALGGGFPLPQPEKQKPHS